MNRMSKILAIGCSLWSLMYLSAVAQDNMDLDTAPATVEDLDITADAEPNNVELLESEVSNDQRVADAADLAEQERVRLQSEAREGRLALSQALEAMQNGQWTRAVDLFGQAQSKMKDVDMFKDELAMARDQKSEAYFQMARGLYDRRRQGGDLKQAEKYLKLSAETNPNNEKVGMLEEDIKEYYVRQDTGREELPIRKEQKYQKAKEEIDRLLLRGRKELEIGDYDQAEETFEKVLAIDRYNRSALRFIEKLTEERWEVYQVERRSSTKKMMSMVEKSWLVPLKVDQRGPKEPFEATTGGLEIAESDLENKLNNIVIDEIDYRQAQIGEVIASLVDFSQQLDPDGIGVNIIFQDPTLNGAGGGAGAPAAAPVADPFGFGAPAGGAAPAETTSTIRPITLRLRNVTLLDALKTVTEVSGLYYRVERNMVIIEREGRGRLITRFYPVDPTRWIQVQNLANTGLGNGGGGGGGDPFGGDPFGGAAAAPAGGSPDLTGLFTRYGVVIPEGGDIAYENLISQLVVTLTPDQFPQFEEVLRKINVAPRQVEIEARFVEVLQSDLEELGFEWILTDDAEILVQDGPGATSTRPRIQSDAISSGLTGGLRFFDFDSTSNSTTPTSRSGDDNSFIGDILSFSGILTNPELQMVIQAVDQNGNTDLLSAPRVTTVHGVNAIIEVVEEIIYPTEFDITENDVDIDGGGDGDNFIFIPPTVEPGGFETRNIGVILNVTPTVNADNYTINLVMLPEIAELVDWLQYGSSIPLGDGTEYIVNIPQPVFASRNLTTSMIVWDGHTVVMGGLIREELTTFDDKVPLLGDIPIIGRLFRSEGRRSEKRNLLIFVTARLVDPAGNSVNAQDRQDLVTGQGSSISSRGSVTPMN
ncbi:hypothetical protein P0Y35_12875 [Kiritimatiellaeota bacterium B1221]|nr:hypothetical protein [Kiritimatiellaeota bacterium B1221]